MSKGNAPAGKWKLRPLDRKCKTFVDGDPVVEGQIRCKVPEWTGNFGELIPELIAQGLRLDELPHLTVHDIGQFVIRAAQGGSLQCGPVGTASHTIVKMPALAPAYGVGDEWADANFGDRHWRLIETGAAKGWTDRATAHSLADLVSFAEGSDGKRAKWQVSASCYRRAHTFLVENGYMNTETGVGTWVTPKGIAATSARLAKGNANPQAVTGKGGGLFARICTDLHGG